MVLYYCIMYTGNKQVDSILKSVEGSFDEYLGKKAPAIPPNIQHGITRILPWLLIVALFFGLFGILGGFANIYASVPRLIEYVISLVMFVLMAFAVPDLFKMKKKSWYLVYYSSLLGIIQTLFVPNIIVHLVFVLIGLYILFQIKPLYRG